MTETNPWDQIDWNASQKKNGLDLKRYWNVFVLAFIGVFLAIVLLVEFSRGAYGLFVPTIGLFVLISALVWGLLKINDFYGNRRMGVLRELQKTLGGTLDSESPGSFSGISESSLEGIYSGISFRIENVIERKGKHVSCFLACSVSSAHAIEGFSAKRIDGLVDRFDSGAGKMFGTETAGNVMFKAKDMAAARAFIMDHNMQIERLLLIAEPIESRGGRIFAKIRRKFQRDTIKLREAVEILAELAKD